MHKPIKYVEKAFTYVARGAWVVFEKLNSINPRPSITPKWADKPLLKSYRKDEAAAGLAAHDGLAVSEVCAGDTEADCGRQAAA